MDEFWGLIGNYGSSLGSMDYGVTCIYDQNFAGKIIRIYVSKFIIVPFSAITM